MNSEQMAEMITQIYKIMGTDDFAEAITTMLWNIYTKATEKGFSKEEAMAITLSFSKSQGTSK